MFKRMAMAAIIISLAAAVMAEPGAGVCEKSKCPAGGKGIGAQGTGEPGGEINKWLDEVTKAYEQKDSEKLGQLIGKMNKRRAVMRKKAAQARGPQAHRGPAEGLRQDPRQGQGPKQAAAKCRKSSGSCQKGGPATVRKGGGKGCQGKCPQKIQRGGKSPARAKVWSGRGVGPQQRMMGRGQRGCGQGQMPGCRMMRGGQRGQHGMMMRKMMRTCGGQSRMAGRERRGFQAMGKARGFGGGQRGAKLQGGCPKCSKGQENVRVQKRGPQGQVGDGQRWQKKERSEWDW